MEREMKKEGSIRGREGHGEMKEGSKEEDEGKRKKERNENNNQVNSQPRYSTTMMHLETYVHIGAGRRRLLP